jgi:hypothetical protein
MGPTCRERALLDAPVAHRAEVNAIVARIAADVDAETVPADVARVAALGYGELARRLRERLLDARTLRVERSGADLVLRAPGYVAPLVEALRAHHVPRQWDPAEKVTRVPAHGRTQLWRAIRAACPGWLLATDDGVTLVPRAA